jgi:dTDP-glucose 4,6-dehydratase
MRILVTGAAGFLGSHLTDRLLADGHSVFGVDNLSTGNLENLAHLAGEPRLRFEERDICLPFDPGPVDYVFNFASPASPPEYLRLAIETLRAGSIGVENTLEIASKYGAGYLHASTSECYGDPLQHPQKEDYWGNVNPVGPRSVYDEAKRYAEALVMSYHRARGVNTHLVRIFNTYGPRLHPSDGRVISNFIMQALRGEPLTVYGDGSHTRSFCYVDDLIEGIMRLSRSDEHFPVNIGNPSEFTILECAQAVLEVTDSKSKLHFEALPQDDPARRCPDITKARTLLGWEPQVQLREGLQKSLDFFRGKIHSSVSDRVMSPIS